METKVQPSQNPAHREMSRFQSACFKLNMYSKELMNLPAQTRKERLIFKTVFESFKKPEIRVFEWGSGRSTIYYTKFLRSKGQRFQWHAIDNNRVWFDKVRGDVSKNGLEKSIFLYLTEFPPFWMKPGWGKVPPPCGIFSPKDVEEIGYVNMPKTVGGKFDVLIIDARFRRRCLMVARDVLSEDGVVIIHDAQKAHYHEGLEAYPHRRFYNTGAWYPLQSPRNQIWIGSLNHYIFRQLKAFE